MEARMLLSETLLRDLRQPGIHSCVAQSIAGLWLAHGLDWPRARFDFEEPPRSNRNPDARAHQLPRQRGPFTNSASKVTTVFYR